MADLVCLCLETAPGCMSSRSFLLPQPLAIVASPHSLPHYSLFTFSLNFSTYRQVPWPWVRFVATYISTIPLQLDSSHDHRPINSIGFHIIRLRRQQSVIFERPASLLETFFLFSLPPLLPPSHFRRQTPSLPLKLLRPV